MILKNKPTDLMKYFSVPGKECKAAEFSAFWSSLTDDEKFYYRSVDLETGLPAVA